MEENKYLKRKERARLEGNRENLALSCNSLGDYYNQHGLYDKALQEYEEEASIYARMGSKSIEMARAQRMIGEMYMLLSDFDKAKEHIHLYLKTAKKCQNKVEEQRAYVTLGRAYLLHGQSALEEETEQLENFRQAEKAFLKSLLLIKGLTGQISKLEQLDMQARCYLNIGVVKEQMGEFENSIEYIEKAIKICKAHDIYELTHLCYISMSLLYHLKINDTPMALRYCSMALGVAKLLPQKVKKICETLITKAEILTKEGDFASAKQILTKAYKKNTPDENDRKAIEKSLRVVVKICQILDELVTTSSLAYDKRKILFEQLGDACCHLQAYQKALEYYHKMLECAEVNQEPAENLIPIYVSLYQTYKDNKQYEKALEYLWKEYELNKLEPAEACSTLCSIGEVCELQKQPFLQLQSVYQRAKDEALKVVSEAKRRKMEKVVYARLVNLYKLHQVNGPLYDELLEEIKERGIDVNDIQREDGDDDADSEDMGSLQQNTPEFGDDVCLEDLTDSDMSDLDETEKPRPHRMTRGQRALTIRRNNKGETQLHQACIAGNLELVRRLLDQGHVVNVRDHAGWIPLHEACNHGYRDIVELLLDRGASVAINDKGGTSCDGITPLYDACVNGYLDVIELLIDRGADATVKTDFGETCLDGLDRWRETVILSRGEQVHYEKLRALLVKPLSKIGVGKLKNPAPLTNDNVKEDEMDEKHESSDSDGAEVHSRRSRFSCRLSSERNSLGKGKGTRHISPRQAAVTAGQEYKNVMERLKHPSRTTAGSLDDDLDDDESSSLPNLKRPAFLDSQEVDHDAWLIDDLGPEKKKRRYFSTPTKEPKRCSSNAYDASNHGLLSKENMQDGMGDQLEAHPPAKNAYQLLRDSGSGNAGGGHKQRPRQPQKLSLSRTSSMSSTCSSSSINGRSKSKPQQTSLIDKGFCRFRSESPIDSNEDSNSSISIISRINPNSMEKEATTTIHMVISPRKASPLKVQATPVLSTTVSFKVKVEDELLLVPVDRKKLNDSDMRWLAEEAAQRYYNLVGLKPALRLKTADGFAYQDTDPVSVSLEQSMLLATVTDWMIAPLAQRYEEMCVQLNKPQNEKILNALERAQSTQTLDLSGHWLAPDKTEPLFRSLLRQSNLRILDLAYNFIRNEGCRQLARTLPTLLHLNRLNLAANAITAEGVQILLDPGLEMEKLLEFQELTLSQNPLHNECLRILHNFCQSTAAGKSLRRLALSQCDLSNLYDFNLNFQHLHYLDLSCNRLTLESLRHLLSHLDPSQMEYLNLSYTAAASAADADDEDDLGASTRADLLVEFFESGSSCGKFKELELCGCHLRDTHLYRIVDCLRNSPHLHSLILSDNVKLTAAGFRYICEKLPHVRRLKAVNCKNFVDITAIEKLSNVKPLPTELSLTLTSSYAPERAEHAGRLRALWESHWGQRSRVAIYDDCVELRVED